MKPLTLCKFNWDMLPVQYHNSYPFKKNESLLFLGEISNAEGHCAIATEDGKIHYMFHTDDFIELTEDEL